MEESFQKSRMEGISKHIRYSYMTDTDQIDYFISLNEMLKSILELNSIEEFFNNDESDLNYFMETFLEECIDNILKSQVIYGENGDDIALEILFNVFYLFIKFHKNKKYAKLFDIIRKIFNDKSHNFFNSDSPKTENEMKSYNFNKFNEIYNSEFINDEKNYNNKFKVGDVVDIPIKYIQNNTTFKYSWVRGKIKSIENDEYLIEYMENYNTVKEIKISTSDFNIYPKGIKTQDWDWRLNLSQWDLIDCFDRGKWYPSTIIEVLEEDDVNGIKFIKYRVGFRLYPGHFINVDEPNDIAENHIDIWNNNYGFNEGEEYNGDKYYGNNRDYDETIPMFSKRIQKFNTYSKIQQKYINFSYNDPNYFSDNDSNESNNPLKVMNDKLNEDVKINTENIYLYEKNGIKNIILGKNNKSFSCYFALLLKRVETENCFESFMNILQDKPNQDEIYTIFYILFNAFNYIHIDYFIEKSNILKNSVLDFMNNLDEKEMKKIPQEFKNLINELFQKIQNNSEKKLDKNFFFEITISLSLREIKTNTFSLRLNGIKNLSEFIEKNLANTELKKKIIELMKKNKIIQEIFGPNYHSQIINKSKEIVKLLLLDNELNKEDIKLIWNCSQRGDLEAKVTIMKLLSDLVDNLNDEYVDWILSNIKLNNDNKVNNEELDLVYKLSLKNDKNEKNILLVVEYLCNCLLNSTNPKIKNNQIFEYIYNIGCKNEIFLEKIINICENSLAKNENSILSYSLLFELLANINQEIYPKLQEFIKEKKLLKIFENNFRLYTEQANEIMKQKGIAFNEGKLRDECIIDNFTHYENVKRRVEILSNMMKTYYKDYDFIPFLKEVLIDKSVSPNDELIFYKFVEFHLMNNEEENNSEIKENMKLKLFELISENKEKEVTYDQLNLFFMVFLDINKNFILYEKKDADDDDDIVNKYNIKILNLDKVELLQGLDNLWDLILKIKSDKVLPKAIHILYKIYSPNFLSNLISKSSDLILNSDSKEIFKKCIVLLEYLITESEKDNFIKPKSHFNLLRKNLVKFPIYLNDPNNDLEPNKYEKMLIPSNTTMNELKIIVGKFCKIPPRTVSILIPEDFFQKSMEKDLFKNLKKNELDDTFNNITLNEVLNDIETFYEVSPDKKLILQRRRGISYREPLLINEELNPKLEKILHEWYIQYTNDEEKMYPKNIAKFLEGVSSSYENVEEDDDKVIEFLNENDQEKKGYLIEEEFIKNYKRLLINGKRNTVWRQLRNMNIREDLKKKEDNFDVDFIENNKLPRYNLGNDLNFIKMLISKYYKNEDNAQNLVKFLTFLTTNESIYNQVLEIFDENKKNENTFVNQILNENNTENKYIELNYIFIIIESILQDLAIFSYMKPENNNNEIYINNKAYKFIYHKYEPFENDDKKEKKILFLKNLIKNENFNIIIKNINYMIQKLSEKNNPKILFYFYCLRGLRILNIINNLDKKIDNDAELERINNAYDELSEKSYFDIKYNKLKNLIKDIDIKEEFNKYIFTDTINILLNYLNKDNYENNTEKLFYNECFNLFMDLLSTKPTLFNEYYNSKEKKEKMEDLFIKLFKNENKEKSKYAIENINKNNIKAYTSGNNNYFIFFYQIINSILNELIINQTQNNEEFNFPKMEFFILYSEINQFFDTIKFLNNNTIIENNEKESFIYKIYELIIDKIIKVNKGEYNNKTLLNLLKLFNTSLQNNSKKKKEFLFSKNEKINSSLFELIIKEYISYLNNQLNTTEKNIINEKEYNTINIDLPKDKIDNKFIIVDDITESKAKNIIDSEELYKLYGDMILSNSNIYSEYFPIQDLVHIFQILKKLENTASQNNKNGGDSDDDDIRRLSPSIYNNSNNSKKQHGYVGLKNLGCICYMNSVMQQMYMVPSFRKGILAADDGKPPNPHSDYSNSCDDDNLLHQLQRMYTFLSFSEKMDYNPKDFCYSYKDFDGNPTNIAVQQDSQEFLNNFCDKIENNLKMTKYKYIISDIFTGSTCSSVVCNECKYMSNRFEDFYNLTLEVKNINNLNDSLHKLIIPEIIDDFKCSNCNKNVRISKITSLNKLPNVLIIHLKRFYLDYETCNTTKINTRFEFPTKIDLKQFCVEEITKNYSIKNDDIYIKEDDYYQYELKGINVHTGTADGGHYFSYIDTNRDGKDNIMNDIKKDCNTWLTFNDSFVSEFNTNNIEEECFGGEGQNYMFENYQNAYLLIYERKKKTPIRIILDKNELDNNQENIIMIDKNNRKEINKEYDINIFNKNVKENNLYQKIFYDKEKNEYYKYTPYYNLKNYVPRKEYEEAIKENNRRKETKNNNKELYTNLLKKFEKILIERSKEIDLRNNSTLNEEDIKNILKIIFGEFISKINSEKNNNEKINREFMDINDKLVDPLLSNKNCSYKILKILNESFISFFDKNHYQILNYDNYERYLKILEKLIILFDKNRIEDSSANKEQLNKTLKVLLTLIKKSSTIKEKNINIFNNEETNEDSNINDNKEKENIYLFNLIYKLIQENDYILKLSLSSDIINNLILILNNHTKSIRDIIYNILLYLLKTTNNYNKELFDLKEDEKEGEIKYDIKLFENIFTKKKQAKILFEEKPELIKIIIIFICVNELDNFIIVSDYLHKLFDEYEDDTKKIYGLIDIISLLILLNDKYCLKRYLYLLGYSNLIIQEIDPEKNKEQNWPLFGERLINGNIKKEIYEYTLDDHNIKEKALLNILFPSEYSNKKEKKIIINEEYKKKILLNFIKNIFIKNNYPLFKYLYLMPSRSLLFKNLYEEIIYYLDLFNDKNEDIKELNEELIKTKEAKYISQIEKEIKKAKEDKDYRYNYYESYYEKKDEFEFKYKDKDIKNFCGFIGDMIPGEIIREEIYGIARKKTFAMYRIHYYTKYYILNELREKLLKEEVKKNNEQNLNKENKEDSLKEEESKKEENEEPEDKDKEKKIDEESQAQNKEKIDTDISDNLDDLSEVERYDISEKNENSIINNIYEKKSIFVLEDKTKQDKSNVKNIVTRFIFLNKTKYVKIFKGKVGSSKIKKEIKLNGYFPDLIKDKIESNQFVSFFQLQRFTKEIDWYNKDEVGVKTEFITD